jgi:hypothetical protein
MPRKLLFGTAAWACLCSIVYATLTPRRDRPTLLISSNVEYLAAFAVFAALLRLAYPRGIPSVLIFVLSSAALLEVLQCLLRTATLGPLMQSKRLLAGLWLLRRSRGFVSRPSRVRGSVYNLDSARPGRSRDPKVVSTSV